MSFGAINLELFLELDVLENKKLVKFDSSVMISKIDIVFDNGEGSIIVINGVEYRSPESKSNIMKKIDSESKKMIMMLGE